MRGRGGGKGTGCADGRAATGSIPSSTRVPAGGQEPRAVSPCGSLIAATPPRDPTAPAPGLKATGAAVFIAP